MTRIGNRRGFSLAESRRRRESSVVEPETSLPVRLPETFVEAGSHSEGWKP